VLKEIVLQHDGKGGVDTGTLEDGIHICPFAAEFFGEPAHRAFLAVKLFLYQFSNVYHTEIKKAEPFVTYFNLRHCQAPCSQISTNSSRPNRT